MITVIGVRFRTAGKIYYFDPAGRKVKTGDHVIVETARGIEYGYVVLGNREVDESKVVPPLKPVIRMATAEDEAVETKNKNKEKEAFKICQDKIKKHNLEMKLIDAEYTFDNNKAVSYTHLEKADALGEAIMERIRQEIDKRPAKYGKYGLHAQVGVMEDTALTPGGRIPIGEEPELPYQIMNFIRMHKGCDAGCGELFPFDDTVKNNPQYLLDILKGAFQSGARYLSFYSGDSDLVRVTGYLVKKSDIEKFDQEEMTLNEATVNGSGVDKNLHLLDRKVRGDK